MRLKFVSMAKAIAIVLMVLAHSGFSRFGSRLISMFHMPLFFFFAGYCFKESYLSDFAAFAGKKVRGLYWPYVKWSLLFLAFHNVLFHLNIYNGSFGWRGTVSQLYGPADFIRHAVHVVTGMWDEEQLLGGYWFLKTLFLSSFIAFFAIKCFRNAFFAVLLLVLAAMGLSGLGFQIPYFRVGANEALGALFFCIGHLDAKYKFDERIPWWFPPIAAVLVLVGTFCWPASFTTVAWWETIPWVASAASTVICISAFCRWLEGKNFAGKALLVYVGDNTLPILTWHFLAFKLVSVLIICSYGLPVERLAEFPVISEYAAKGWAWAYCTAGVVLPVTATRLLDCRRVRSPGGGARRAP